MQEEVLFLTHRKSDRITKDLKLLRDTSGNRQLTALTHALDINISGVNQFKFNDSVIEYLNYPMISNAITPGHAHFPLFYYFLKRRPVSDFYWIIEYDVRFTGKWSYLFNSFEKNKSDFLTAHIKSYNEEPEWPWWDLEHTFTEIPLSERWRSFNPIFRISKRAMTFLHDKFISGWKGHNEVLLITLLKHNGFSVGDFNYQPLAEDKMVDFYSSRANKQGKLLVGSHRHKPPMTKPGFRKNKIYHPVKEDSRVGRVRWTVGNALRKMRMNLS